MSVRPSVCLSVCREFFHVHALNGCVMNLNCIICCGMWILLLLLLLGGIECGLLRHTSQVAWSVCLSVLVTLMYYANTAELIKMPFGANKEPSIVRGRDSPRVRKK